MPRGRKKQKPDSDSNNQGGGTSNRGFASMDPERRREIAREGGRSSHSGGRGSRSGSREIESGNYGRNGYRSADSRSFDIAEDQSSGSRSSGRGGSSGSARRTQIINEDEGDAHTISITAFTILNDTTIDDSTRVRMLREYFNG